MVWFYWPRLLQGCLCCYLHVHELLTEFGVKYNSAKINMMVFCCDMLNDIPVTNVYNGVAIDNVYNCKYLGHCINDKLIDDDGMVRQRKQICSGK